MRKAVIVSAARTPIGKYLGSLRSIPAYELGAIVLNEVIARAGIQAEQVDEVIMGQAYQNGESVNIARMALLAAGWPVEIPGGTIDRRCLSGLDSVCTAAMKIASGYADVIVAGGIESMSRTELYIPGDYIKWGIGGQNDEKWGLMPKGHGALSMWGLPLFDRIQRARVMSQPIERFGELNSMMTWAEAAAKNEGISREEADRWALRSHEKAISAIEKGLFKEEVVGVPIPLKKGGTELFSVDETPRADVSMEKLGRLPVVYDGGICTAGNSSTENDGAAAVVVMSSDLAEKYGLEPLGELASWAIAAADPALTYPAVPASVTKALKMAGQTIADMDLIEIQEAFSAQVLADAKLMGLDAKDMEGKVNINGSGISLGHPIAATGTMRLITLLYEMRRSRKQTGMVTICGGGGQGIAALISASKS